MASTGGRCLGNELVRFLESRSAGTDVRLVQSALMWLLVSQRPLRAHELWIALRIQELKDPEDIVRLCAEGRSTHTDEREAASFLQSLLGEVITLAEDPSSRDGIRVAFRSSEAHASISGVFETTARDSELSSLSFTVSEAHKVLAGVCMSVCSATTLYMGYPRKDNEASSLMLYSWSHWSTHLALSGCSVGDTGVLRTVDSMIYSICADTLALLVSLSDFITSPISFPSAMDWMESAEKVQQVQVSLENPLLLLATVVRGDQYPQSRQDAHPASELFRDPMLDPSLGQFQSLGDEGNRIRPFKRKNGRSGGPEDSLRGRAPAIGEPSVGAEPLEGNKNRLLTVDMAEIARSLRLLSPLLDKTILDKLLPKQSKNVSEAEIFTNVAGWAEAMATCPFWRGFDKGAPPRSCTTGDGKPVAAFGKRNWPSKTRRRAASVVYGVATLRGVFSTATYTINGGQSLPYRLPPLASLPEQLYTAKRPFSFAQPLISKALQPIYCKLASLFAPIFSDHGLAETFGLGSYAINSRGEARECPTLKSIFLADGFRCAAAYVLIGIILNHVRRTLFPWLGNFTFLNPMEDLRLALERPDVFLKDTLLFDWSYAFFSFAQKHAWDVMSALSLRYVVQTDGRPPLGDLYIPSSDMAESKQVWERHTPVARVGCLLWLLGTAEYVFTRVMYTLIFLVAFWKLLRGNETDQAILWRLISDHPFKTLFIVSHSRDYLRDGICPAIYASARCAASGRPGLLFTLLSVLGAVVAVIKYRSRFFIALQMSGLFLALGYASVALALLAAEFVCDPLGLEATTAVVRRSCERTRRAVPRGTSERIDALWRGSPCSTTQDRWDTIGSGLR